jgi:hypothetical protein
VKRCDLESAQSLTLTLTEIVDLDGDGDGDGDVAVGDQSATKFGKHGDDSFKYFYSTLVFCNVHHLEYKQSIQDRRTFHRRPTSNGIGTSGISCSRSASGFRDIQRHRAAGAPQLIQERRIAPWNVCGNLSR